MQIHRASRGSEEEATSFSYNRRRRGVESQENSKQVTDERKRQVSCTVKEIYNRIQYLEKKEEFRKYKGDN